MNRRGFLTGILAAACAPAIVRADSLMRIVPREAAIVLPTTEFMIENGIMTITEWNETVPLGGYLYPEALARELRALLDPIVPRHVWRVDAR